MTERKNPTSWFLCCFGHQREENFRSNLVRMVASERWNNKKKFPMFYFIWRIANSKIFSFWCGAAFSKPQNTQNNFPSTNSDVKFNLKLPIELCAAYKTILGRSERENMVEGNFNLNTDKKVYFSLFLFCVKFEIKKIIFWNHRQEKFWDKHEVVEGNIVSRIAGSQLKVYEVIMKSRLRRLLLFFFHLKREPLMSKVRRGMKMRWS